MVDSVGRDSLRSRNMQFDCTICGQLGNFWRDLGSIGVTKCGHVFHMNCVMTHICSQPRLTIDCPMPTCKKKIKQTMIIQIDLSVIKKDSNNKYKPAVCVLCVDAVPQWDNIAVTKCGHIYHSVCVEALVKCVLKRNNVRHKSNECMVPSCKAKVTHASITKIHVQEASGRDVTDEELLATLEDREIPCRLNNEPKCGDSPVSSCEKETTLATTQHLEDEECDTDVAPECSNTTVEPLPLLLQNKKAQKDDQIDLQIKHELQRECIMNVLDEHCRLQSNEITQNQEIDRLKQKCQALGEQMAALQKERDEAKRDTEVWEMTFTYLREICKDTEMMIPDEKTLELIKQKEKLEIYTQQLERERNEAKNDTALWEMSFSYLRDQCKETEMMIPEEKTLQLIKENGRLKMCIQDFKRELGISKKDVTSAKSPKADFVNYIEENLNLKTKNEEMKRELQTVREDMVKLDSTITDLVVQHSQENDTLRELNGSLIKENSRLTELNDTLQKDMDKWNDSHKVCNDTNNTLKNNNKNKSNEDMNEDINILQIDNDELDKLNETFLNDINKLNIVTKRDNDKLNKVNDTLQKGNNKLNEYIYTLHKDNIMLRTENKKLMEIVSSLHKQKRDMNQIIRRETCLSGFQVTKKRRASEMSTSAAENRLMKREHINVDNNNEAENDDIENKEAENADIENKEAENEDIENKKAENVDIENKEAENEDIENKETKKVDIENKEAENEDIVNKEAENDDIENKEAENEEVVMKEVKKEEIENKEIENEEVVMEEVKNEDIENEEVVNKEIEEVEFVNKEAKNKEVVMKEVKNEEIENDSSFSISSFSIVMEEVKNEDIENKEVVNKEIEEEEFVNKEAENEEVVMKEVKNEDIENEEVVNKEIEDEEFVNKEAENEEIVQVYNKVVSKSGEPSIKRIKIENNANNYV